MPEKCTWKKAQQILNQYHELNHIMSGLADSSHGRINLGVTVAGGQQNLMDIFPAFHQKYPFFSLKLVEGNVMFLEKKLLDGTIDLAWSGSVNNNPLFDNIITRPKSASASPYPGQSGYPPVSSGRNGREVRGFNPV